MYYDFSNPKYYLVMKFYPPKNYLDFAGLGDVDEIITCDFLLCNRNRNQQKNSSITLHESNNLSDLLEVERIKNEFIMKLKAVTKEVSKEDEEGILEFCGYDILENNHSEISHLLNCGVKWNIPEETIFTKYGLIDSYDNVIKFIELNKGEFYNDTIDYMVNLEEDIIAIWRYE